jgi:hypothetical protein
MGRAAENLHGEGNQNDDSANGSESCLHWALRVGPGSVAHWKVAAAEQPHYFGWTIIETGWGRDQGDPATSVALVGVTVKAWIVPSALLIA